MTTQPESNETGGNGRPPQTLKETVIANFRPQPAIPAVLICMLAYSFSIFTSIPGDEAAGFGFASVLIALGIASSCGLAIAAGFCSLFPQVIWLLLALWGLRLIGSGALAAYNRYILLAGIAAVTIMFLVQIWRVMTGRFVPTIRIDSEDH